MKSPLYLLTALLPLAAMAMPAAEPEEDGSFDSLEERDGGGRGGDRDRDSCRVRNIYWYYQYPCESSDKVGRSNPGDNFQPICKYHDWYKNSKGWWTQERNKPRNCRVRVKNC
ncbi:unnamed protein product [Penicillium glandicola]